VAQVLRRFAQDQAMERWRRHIAEGRLAALTGDTAGLENAKRLARDAAAELESLGRPIAGEPEGAKAEASPT
jgi:hypothetical protein